MKVLEGGKENPEWKGQPMSKDLRGRIVPAETWKPTELPVAFNEKQREKAEKLNTLLKELYDIDDKFLIITATPPETEGEAIQMGSFFRGTDEDKMMLFQWLAEELARVGVLRPMRM